MLIVGDQGLRFETGAVEGQRPGFADAAHVGQGLFDDRPARIWRGELIANVYYPQAARQLGDYLAQVLFHTSDFYLHPHEKKAQVAQFINPAMCEITEDLFFNDPYRTTPAPDSRQAGGPPGDSRR